MLKRIAFVLALLLAPLATAAPALAVDPYSGVAIAGAEFNGKKFPAVHGKDYIWPSDNTISYFIEKGFCVLRIPFRWERLQPKLNGPFDAAEQARMDRVVASITERGCAALLDPHGYAHYVALPDSPVIGSSAVPVAAFTDGFLKPLAQHYKGNPLVYLGIMNEPNKRPENAPEPWRAIVDASIIAIRSTGATNWIYAGGTSWQGMWSWEGSGNAKAFETPLPDPLNRTVLALHAYADANRSGTTYGPIADPQAFIKDAAFATAWARQFGYKLVMEEFGVPPDAASLKALDTFLAYMKANADVWVGWNYWAGGEWWGNYPFSIDPKGGEKPQMGVLSKYANGSVIGIPNSPPPPPDDGGGNPPPPPPPPPPPGDGGIPIPPADRPPPTFVFKGASDGFTVTVTVEFAGDGTPKVTRVTK